MRELRKVWQVPEAGVGYEAESHAPLPQEPAHGMLTTRVPSCLDDLETPRDLLWAPTDSGEGEQSENEAFSSTPSFAWSRPRAPTAVVGALLVMVAVALVWWHRSALQAHASGVMQANLVAPRSKPPCSCQASSASWKAAVHAGPPRCFYFGAGANTGKTYKLFRDEARPGLPVDRGVPLDKDYFEDWPVADFHFSLGPTASRGRECSATLVEANPSFEIPLKSFVAEFDGDVKALVPEAVYMCEGNATFYLDTVNKAHDYWGSSLSPRHQDVVSSRWVHVTVPTMNLNRFLHEHVRKEDFVVIDMDIEGAEWDILPCLAKSPSKHLVDALYMEVHQRSWGLVGTTRKEFMDAVKTLQDAGVRFPSYNTDVRRL